MLTGTLKGFPGCSAPLRPADDGSVVAPICVGCDFSSRAQEPRCQREGRADLSRLEYGQTEAAAAGPAEGREGLGQGG